MARPDALPKETYDQQVVRLRTHDLGCLNPEVRRRVEAAVAQCTEEGFPVQVFETCRCAELAQLYFAHGVSKAATIDHTWHGYKLAVDVIHPVHEWSWYPGEPHYNTTWWSGVYRVFGQHGLQSGANFNSIKDYPHWQPAEVPKSPTSDDVALLHAKGPEAVWAKYQLSQ